MSFNSGFINGAMIGSTLSNNHSNNHNESIANKIIDVLDSDRKFNEDRRNEREVEKDKIKKNRYCKLDKTVLSNKCIDDDIKRKILLSIMDINLYGFYMYDVNEPHINYVDICREYQSRYYKYQGTYRCVAWRGDILSESEINKLKLEKEELETENKKLDSQAKDVGTIYYTTLTGNFKNLNFTNYSNHIRKNVIDLIVPEFKNYIMDISKETLNDIIYCTQEIDNCIREIDFILKRNQENIEKTLSYKISKLFKRR